jgi:lipopolysaccharide heptosyltransferase II
VLSWKNRLIIRLVHACRSHKRDSDPIQRILIVSTTALGDTLWATPAIANLRSHFPKAYIAVLTSPTGREVLKHNPHIDRFYLLKEPLMPRFFSLWRQLKKEKFDAALIFHASQRLALPLCALSQIKRIIGTTGINKGLDDLLTDPVEARFEHEIERRFRICDRLEIPRQAETLSYYVQPEERAVARQLIGVKEKKPLVAMHPGSKEPFRRWPPRCFAAVGQALQDRFGCEIFLTGSPSEAPLLREVQRYLPTARLASVSHSIRYLGAFLEQMDLVLSNDTGPLHLACALNRPTVGLYVSTDPCLCGPYKAPRASAIWRSPTCDPCLKRRCQEPFCFLQISPAEVIDICSQMLTNKN